MKRLDLILVERGLFESREKAQASIIAGEIWSGEVRLDKAGAKLKDDIPLDIRSRIPAFASRGGHKLEAALDQFQIQVAGKVAIDIGSSTGGFTDCLLKRGAEHVIAVDVGHGQLDQKLRNDHRVTSLEKVNARYLEWEGLPEGHRDKISLGTMDVSFISSRIILAHLVKLLPDVQWIILFKPQFEVGKEHILKGGVVRDEETIRAALASYVIEVSQTGLKLLHSIEPSPISGKKSGNLEYLIHLGPDK